MFTSIKYFISRERAYNFSLISNYDNMPIKYWEYEDAPLKEKMKNPTVREVAKIYFENETRAYRFAMALMEVKDKGQLRLKDCNSQLPLATWKRYLDFGVTVGLLKHEDGAYSFTDRYTKPFRNIPIYIKSWIDGDKKEDLSILFVTAKTTKQKSRRPPSTEISESKSV